ncbi:Integrin alpha-10 [Liparis tanakae]|uniref:Integrin alpha-10 n=1 Tax=Liparis tanakae TaxID=230148 RepID=A0A4Z2ISX4_9TELE|nr:Integrin alpha-10 [Liparis tanakae]
MTTLPTELTGRLQTSQQSLCRCFNIDVKHPRIFTGPADALFGFSVLQHESNGEKSSWGEKTFTPEMTVQHSCVNWFYWAVGPIQGRPSTVASLNSCPTVKVMWVVRTVVEVLMDSFSPSCVISTNGLEAAFTAINRSILFTPRKTHTRFNGPAGPSEV